MFPYVVQYLTFVFRSKQSEKSAPSKYIDLVSVTSCARETPKKLPFSSDAAALEGRCVTMGVDKRLITREGSADIKGAGIDLRFENAEAAVKWVEIVNSLRASASLIFTGGTVSYKV